jgi:hypothetical protein
MWEGEPRRTRTDNPLIKSQASPRNVPQTRTVPGLARSLAVAKSPLGQLFNRCLSPYSMGIRKNAQVLPHRVLAVPPRLGNASEMPRFRRSAGDELDENTPKSHLMVLFCAQRGQDGVGALGAPGAGMAREMAWNCYRKGRECGVNTPKHHRTAPVRTEHPQDGLRALRAFRTSTAQESAPKGRRNSREFRVNVLKCHLGSPQAPRSATRASRRRTFPDPSSSLGCSDPRRVLRTCATPAEEATGSASSASASTR